MKQAVLYKYDPTSESEVFLATTDDMASIGKSLQADVTLNDWRCNGIHALIKKSENGIWKLIDLGSYFGTYVNKEKISAKEINDGDHIIIGGHDIIVRLDELDEKNILPAKQEEVSPQDSSKSSINKFSKHVLEVSLFWGDQLLELKTFNRSDEITIGGGKDDTFSVHLDVSQEGDSLKLADYNHKTGNLNLSIPKDVGGVVWIDDKTHAFDTLRYYDIAYKGKQRIDMLLKQSDRAHVEFGELSLDFRFVVPAEKIHRKYFYKIDPKIKKMLGGILAFYLLLIFIFSLGSVEEKEKTLDDIPEHLKKVVYDIGVKSATQKRQAAIGQIAQSLEGGRARAAEGASKTKKSPTPAASKQSEDQKKVEKKVDSKQIVQAPVVESKAAAAAPSIDLDSSFAVDSKSEVVDSASVLSEVTEDGNTASALASSGFARGKSGLDAGGGGSSVGVGALKGNLTGGGMGSGDYGLTPSKGRQIALSEEEEVQIQGGLDPDLISSIIKRYLPQIQHCYEQGLVKVPTIKGKVTVGFVISGEGIVTKPKIVDSDLNHTPTEVCIIGKVATWKFPRPKGGGTVGVKYPFILMSSSDNQ